MADVLTRLEALGLALPTPAPAIASYVPARIHAGLVYVSGQLPFVNGSLTCTGPVPEPVSVERAREAASICALNGLAAAAHAAGGPERLAGVVRVGCFVNAPPLFRDHPTIANGASDLLASVFGTPGQHARAAVGCPSLPLDATVEVEFLFALVDG